MKTITRLYILQVIMIGAIICILVVMKFEEEKRFNLFLKSTKENNEKLVNNILEMDREVFLRPLHDNSEWDETVNYVGNPTENFEVECLNTLLSTFSFNHIWVFNQTGHLLYYINDSNSLSLDTILSAAQIKTLLTPGTPTCHFFVNVKGELVEISGATIVPTEDRGHITPQNGFLFFARNWNATLLKQFEGLIGSDINPLILKNPQEQNTVEDPATVDYSLYDEKSNRIAKLVFAFPNAYFQEWKENTLIQSLINIFIGLLVILFIGFLTRKWLILPLKLLMKTLDTGELRHLQTVKSLQNEFGRMAQLIEKSIILNNELHEEIQHRIEAEKNLAALKDKAEESDRLKTSFLSNMSHEIRTPMNCIIGFISLLETDDYTVEERRHFMSMVSNSGKQLLSIINDILDISRIESGQIILKPVHFDINQVLDSLLISFNLEKQRAEKNDIVLTLIKGIADDQCHIYCDKVRLEQIINNLLTNALKFTFSGKITFGYSVEKEDLLFFVHDTGLGISSQNMEMIFERFRQEEESHTRKIGGTGLGLPISKGLVEKMGGKVRLTSEKGTGSSFYFNLPNIICHDAIPAEKPLPPLQQSSDLSDKTILIVEDSSENIELISIMLKSTNIRILSAANGQIAVDLCLENPSIDMILMDMQMPIMNGYDATKEIKKSRPNLPIIALTAYAFDKDRKNCAEAGCNDFLSKPVNRFDLLQKVYDFLKKD